MNLRVLAVVAHPADAFDMIGGTLAGHVERGDQVTVAIMNNMSTLNDCRLADEIRAGRARGEQGVLRQSAQEIVNTVREACRILGFDDVRLLEYPEEFLTESAALRGEVATLYQQLRPHIVITHHPMEEAGASEHGICGRLAVAAAAIAEGARAN